jgi:FixJ family two-component response regulator
MIPQSRSADHFQVAAVPGRTPCPASGRPVLSTLSTISVIDDDVSVGAAIDNLLSSHGYLVHTFASAEEFLRSAQRDVSSCIISDVQMGPMSGLDLLAQMRSRGDTTPFIFITAFPEESIRARALKAGAIGFLTKPFAGPALVNGVETALNDHRGGTDK